MDYQPQMGTDLPAGRQADTGCPQKVPPAWEPVFFWVNLWQPK